MIHITRGNNKIGKTANISLPPIISCINSDYCGKDCYAIDFYRVWPEVTNAWDNNWSAWNKCPQDYFYSIRRYLLHYRPKYFRWHVGGDIPNQLYLDYIKETARDYFFTRFLVFTKNYYLDFSGLTPNLSIVLSAWPGLQLPLGNPLPLAFVNLPEENRAHHCIRCPGHCEGCRACWDLRIKGKNVLLEKH